jgi:hypothetical protein
MASIFPLTPLWYPAAAHLSNKAISSCLKGIHHSIHLPLPLDCASVSLHVYPSTFMGRMMKSNYANWRILASYWWPVKVPQTSQSNLLDPSMHHFDMRHSWWEMSWMNQDSKAITL